MNKDDNRNMFIFIALSMAIMFIYQIMIVNPQMEKQRAQAKLAQSSAAVQAKAKNAEQGPSVATFASNLTREQALSATPRIAIDTPALKGSISLIGARIDDLYLGHYRQTLDPKSPLEELLRPKGAQHAFFVQSGFIGQNVANLPNDLTQWTLISGTSLGIGKTITLGFDNGAGLKFERTLSVDNNYLISVTEKVFNTTALPVTLASYANVERIGDPKHNVVNAFEGGIAAFSKDVEGKDYHKRSYSYHDWIKKTPQAVTSKGGWIGITDKYWLTAVIPDQKTNVHAAFRVQGKDEAAYFQAGYVANPMTLAPGTQGSVTSHIFAGAKLDNMLKDYETNSHIPLMSDAIDWGNIFFWVSKPIFIILDFLNKLFNSFGLALLGLTVIIRGIFYPFASKSYESMIKMNLLKPQIDLLKERHKDDAQKLQVATMELYQKEKINVMAGCLPMLLQIPVFLALSKVFFNTIEMRQAPFFGFLNDLSAREPTTIWNLFGLLPFDPAHLPLIGGILDGVGHVGIWAVIYGGIMWLTQAMTPMTTVDPMQKKIFALMPIFLPFFMSSLPAGLLIYYSWSSVLTIAQQYLIYRQFKVENPIDNLIHKLTQKKAA